ncbi:MAG: 1-acyl-sn-glycerol-3-phosphate acyltransferase [Deltaproteobacteria bacterium]|nr:1-acyl-sn-glycerol-3-phosphate acyltransferase [Deltaproteobacteria bacterium]
MSILPSTLRVDVAPAKGLLCRFFDWAFLPVQFSPEAKARLEHVAAKGRVVYVLRSSSFLSALLLATLVRTSGLPVIRYVSHLTVVWWQSLGFLLRALFARDRSQPSIATLILRRREAEEQRWLGDALKEGHSALLFLFRPRSSTTGRIKAGEQALLRLLRASREAGVPVQIVAVSFFYDQAREHLRRSLVDFMFGPRSGPGRLRELGSFLLHRYETIVSVGEPIAIAALDEACASEDVRTVDAMRTELLKSLQQHARIVRGPRLRPRGHVLASVLRDPDLQAEMAEETKKTGKPLAELRATAYRYVNEIAADYREHYIRVFRHLLDWVFNRIYDGVVVDETGFDRLREAVKDTTVVITPCHKSHSDYLILSYVFRVRGLQCPHIVAGINLSFWPLGRMFRGAGAFFVRRTFKGNALYGATFKAYVKRLLHDGTTMEFFPEGGRSRTGRLLLPKIGMFKYVVEAWRSPGAPEITFVPVSIDYEKIIEHASYQAELQGKEKKREDFSALLRTRKILRSRYGRVHVSFGAPIKLSQFAARRGVDLPDREATKSGRPKCSDEESTMLARALSYQVMHDIGRVATVTPSAVTAAVLLNPRRGSVSRQQLFEQSARLLAELKWLSAPISRALHPAEPALDEALKRFEDEKRIRIEHKTPNETMSGGYDALLSVPSENRLGLVYYQNQITQHVLSHAIVAVAALALGSCKVEELRVASLELSRMMKHEFSFRADRPFESLFALIVTELVAQGLLVLEAPPSARAEADPQGRANNDALQDTILLGRIAGLEALAGFLDATIGAYVATLDALDELTQFPLWEKELAIRAVDRVRAWLLDGRIKTSESLQKPLVQSALAWLRDLGVVAERPDKTLALTEKFNDPENLRLVREHFGRFLFSYGNAERTSGTPPPIMAGDSSVTGAAHGHREHRL